MYTTILHKQRIKQVTFIYFSCLKIEDNLKKVFFFYTL